MPTKPAGELLPGTLDLLILRSLRSGPQHGFAIMRWIEHATGGVIGLEEGSLYPALYRLHSRGLLASTYGTSENNRRARYYHLTVDGRRELVKEIREFSTYVEAMFAAINLEPETPR